MSRNSYLLFFLILFAGLILRLISLEVNGLWLDEIWSMLASAPDKSLKEVIQNALNDTHPPLYDVLLYWSLRLTDNAEYTSRYLALIFGIIGVALSFFYGKKMGGKNDYGFLLMALCSFNFFHIYYSMEGRFYSLLFLLCLICTAEFYLFFRDDKWKHAIYYLLAAITLCYTHYYGGILLASLSVVALIYLIIKAVRIKQFLRFAGTQLLVLLAFLPCLPYLFGKSQIDSWMSLPSITDFFNYFYLYSGKNPLEFLWLFLPLIFFFKLDLDKKLKYLLYILIFLGFLLPFAISHFSVPMLHKRYTIIYLPAILIMASFAWPNLKYLSWNKSKKIYGLIALSCILNIAFLRDEFREGSKDQWKEVAEYLKRQSADQILADRKDYLNFYLERMEMPEAKAKLIPKEGEGDIWLLRTNFDVEDPMAGQAFEVQEKIAFPKNFELYHLSKTKNEEN